MKDNNGKSFLNRLIISIISIYIFGIIIFTPYYNWNYAKEHGFVKWLLFGEIVPTLKGLSWPYFVYAGFKSSSVGISDTAKKEIQHFSNSIEFRNQALRILNPPEATGLIYELSEADQQLGINMLKKSINETEKVSNETLRHLHNELPSHYRNEFAKGLALFISGLETQNIPDAIKGQKLLDDFGEWYTGKVVKQ